jgi:hypothetical protein
VEDMCYECVFISAVPTRADELSGRRSFYLPFPVTIPSYHSQRCVFITAVPITGTREEPGTLTQGAPVFPGSSRLGIEPQTPGWLVQDPRPNHQPIGGSDPNHLGIWSPPRRGNVAPLDVCLFTGFVHVGSILRILVVRGGVTDR